MLNKVIIITFVIFLSACQGPEKTHLKPIKTIAITPITAGLNVGKIPEKWSASLRQSLGKRLKELGFEILPFGTVDKAIWQPGQTDQEARKTHLPMLNRDQIQPDATFKTTVSDVFPGAPEMSVAGILSRFPPGEYIGTGIPSVAWDDTVKFQRNILSTPEMTEEIADNLLWTLPPNIH